MLLNRSARIRKFALAAMLVSATLEARPTLEPAGLAAYTETARDIYVAGLLLAPGTGLDNIFLAPGPKEMEYRIATRRISSRGFSGTLLLQAEMGSGQRAPDHVISVINDLKDNIKGALMQGDQFVISLSADDTTSFYLNGTELLSVADGSVFDFFFAGWVGESSSSLLRDNLLAGSIDPDIMARYRALEPASKRVATITEWAQPEPAPETEDSRAELAAVPIAAVAEATVAKVSAAAVATPAKVATANTVTTEITAVADQASETALATATEIATAADSSVPDGSAEFEPTMLDSDERESVQLALAGQTPILAIDDRDYQRQLAGYISEVMTSVFAKVKYPRRAVKQQREGKVELLATLSAEGELTDLALENTSGYDILDDAAAKAVEKAAPFPELTDVAREEFLSKDGNHYVVMIPVTFRLQ